MTPHVLVVDDEIVNIELIEAYLRGGEGTIERALDGATALRRLEETRIDLVLLDVQMPGLDGFEVCRRIKLNPRTRLIPVVMVTALNAVEARVRALDAGADDFLSKPVERLELIARVGSLLRLKRVFDSLADSRQVIRALAEAVEARDSYTEAHTERVTASARALGAAAGLDPEELEELFFGASIHDIGKIGVPDSILLKPGPLTAEEIAIMRRHPDIGAQILAPLESSPGLMAIVRHHHENVDGTGYPGGLKANEIPIGARIVAVCDAYDALVSDRPYRSRLLQKAAIHILRSGAGRQWDAELVSLFTKHVLGNALGEGDADDARRTA